MKLKIVKHKINQSAQAFVTFEYQKLQFDMYKDLENKTANWAFLEDESYGKLTKLTNINVVLDNCKDHLKLFDFKMGL